MKSHSLPPRPRRAVFVPYTTFETEMLPGFAEAHSSKSDWDFEIALSHGIIDTLHTHGVTAERMEIFYFGRCVYITLWLAAGEWRAHECFGARRDRNPVRAVCAKTLRFIRRENENLE